jgi:hypothetical protein
MSGAAQNSQRSKSDVSSDVRGKRDSAAALAPSVECVQ